MATPAAAAPTFSELPLLPGFSVAGAADINSSVVAVGEVSDNNGARAVRWAADGAITALPGLPAAKRTHASAINENGTAIGTSDEKAVRWGADGTVTALGSEGAMASYAHGINDHDVVVGVHLKPGWISSGVKWDADGKVQVLEPYDTRADNTPTAINNSGVIAGHSGRQPIWWDANGKVRALPTPQSYGRGETSGINERGDISGTIYFRDDERAVTWIRDLPGEHGHEKVYRMEYLPLPPNATHSRTTRISDVGTVGWVQFGSATTHAVTWDADGQVTELGVPAGRADSAANGISANGWIVGSARTEDPDKEIPAPAIRWAPTRPKR
ncbi:hypothetical protein AOZ06_36395 [Kibdelosporangium phytohabitans]|uniref:HAF repeat-containing protein n=1 Tax=Kibdelosporangium phytohabitans TaxID=860235 RepID=A0A0N9IAU5_9PSEU|nr:hypothetical protein [Kibdelosporangium phytohabitans]ALG11625.1 hypothetical protein AOZ06_36395 [Kibdelosporangium phytohabitans]